MKDIKNIKKGQTKILELKNSVNELKNEIASVVKQREDRINDLEERNFEIKSYTRTKIKNKNEGRGLPWWIGSKESICQCRRHRFDPWTRMIPHASEPLSPCTTTIEMVP
ncbi:unnamed protein product [Rangifer tarandus platyrhynchus]|uniref:Uncharacterized protein n=1 Tax=Rangifer tarandus platyrhynchus TaxID=3082113 RepID=A0AC59YRD8_RANTA